ncbi:hypothetical protein HK101_000501 [Irineochytrium annulatum]|nr:hypothetical protein HK101_000501 [Irineochytrium annulatum]
MIDIESANKADPPQFCEYVNVLFETAPPLATALLARRPFASWDCLIDAGDEIIASMSDRDKIVVINAHPRIGAPKAELSAHSLKEQGYAAGAGAAAVSKEDEATNALLRALNEEYEAKFGFKFVVFVAGRPRSAIPDVIRERMKNTRGEELATGLKDMMAIARDRLRKM